LYAGWKKASAVALATGVAAAVTAALAITPAGAASPAQAVTASKAAAAKQGKVTWITLITGDRVAVNAKGKVIGIQRAAGRADVSISVRKAQGHTYVIPLDAAKLIAAGKVDRRLFDVTTQSRAEYVKAQAKGLGYIVTYKGSKPEAKAELHAADGAEITHTYSKLNGESVTTDQQDTAGVWQALTNEPKGASPYATAESGLKTVWFNAIQKASDVDWSRTQIGAPTAWAQSPSLDGTGVKIAILDTGIRTTHADLNGAKVETSKNFSTATTADDKFGHGTHVASIAAGTGAASSGYYKGVAPGATLLNGKVLDDTGSGDDAGILAGLQWAAENAKIVNLSLGGTDVPGNDVLESAVNTLSAQYGTLFVIAAGNEGDAAGTVGSPGSADSALTVGAVDKTSALADFSSRGPRVGDDAVKPDLTAPGVDVTAAAASGSVIDKEVGENPAGYLTISGTSMATPHVAGAAAILAQEHPAWTGEQIKDALVSSTTDAGLGYTSFQQGSGQADLTKAITQTVTADSSVSFATASWPHTDDTAETKTITYTNTGAADVTLDLTASGTDPSGAATAAGFFTLSASTVTVPAGGTATVDLTADPNAGSVIGSYSGYVVGTSADGQTVRTAAGITREVESYTLTLKHLNRSGAATENYIDTITGLSSAVADQWQYVLGTDRGDTVKVRLPKGTYTLDSDLVTLNAAGTAVTGEDYIAHPKISLTGDASLTFDSRTAKALKVTVPDTSAKQVGGSVGFMLNDSSDYESFLYLANFTGFRTAHSGAALSASALTASINTSWRHGSKEYNTSAAQTKKFFTGYTKVTKAADYAKVTTKANAVKTGTYGTVLTYDDYGNGGPAVLTLSKLPYTRTVYVTAKTSTWGQLFVQAPKDLSAIPVIYSAGNKTYTAGKSYTSSFNGGVIGPIITSSNGNGIYRTGDTIFGIFGLFTDAAGHIGGSDYDKASTTIYRNGTKLKTLAGSIDDLDVAFTVPAGNAKYKLTTTVTRSSIATVSSKITSTWTFSSKHVAADDFVKLPASVVRYSPTLTTSNTSKAKATVKVPVKVQGSAAGSNLKSLTVYYSVNGGTTWKKLKVSSGKVTLKNPAAGKGVSFKANVTDKKGNTLSQIIYNAYLAK